MQKIINFFKNTLVQRIILLVGIFVLITLFITKCQKDKGEITRLNQNIAYYQDSLRVSQNKAGEWEYAHNVLAATNKNLESLNKDLADEVKKEKGNVVYLSKIVTVLEQKIIEISNTTGGQIDVEINDNKTQTITFKYSEVYSPGNSRHLEGKVDVGFHSDEFTIYEFLSDDKEDTIKVKIPVIDKNATSVSIPIDSIVMTLITGLKENEKTGFLEIFVRSNYPGFSVAYLDGAIIDPHKSTLIKSYFPPKKWALGVSVGPSVMVDFKGQFHAGVALTLGLQYNLWQWNFKKVK